ncbi:MAG: hypothetical protein QOE97_564 [Pseudonocardiales bacterium]|nr:hypothetical protein [Pseudonocardiales bacterium]
MQTELLAVDDADLQDFLYDGGWTDGLPVVAPTEEAVAAMLAGAGIDSADGGQPIGSIPSHQATLDAEHAAVAAVMAGCLPEYFPVVLAALAAALDPAFNLQVACTSTGGAAICVVVSGPLAAQIGMNAGHNALASGNRANATIGRAVRLAAVNLLRTQLDGTEGTSLGHPGKYSFCFAERADDGWGSLHAGLGYHDDVTTVTVAPTSGPIQVANHLNADPDGVAASLAAAMRMPSSFSAGKGAAQFVIALGPEHEVALREGGWTRADLRRELTVRSRIRAQDLLDAGVLLEQGSHHDMVPDADGFLGTVSDPDDIVVVTTGGAGGGWSAVIPSWAPKKHAQVVSRRVRLPGEKLPDCGPDGCAIDWDAIEGRL